MTGDQLLARLRDLPGVKVEESAGSVDLSYYILHFTQPIDHNDPTKGTFQQEVSLLHRSELAPVPMIIYTSGYADGERDGSVELTTLLAANQVSIEHRYYGTSRPDVVDWSTLTIAQAAADEHEIISALRTIYGGAFLTAGTSKGGMTAVFHRVFYPDEVEGTVAYGAPISFGAPDPRYPRQFDKIGTDGCRAAVRNVASEMLVRRDQMLARAELQAGHTYSRVKIGPAVEAAIAGLEWAFWQTAGARGCLDVPSTTASDDALFTYLDGISKVSEYDDEHVLYYAPYYYQTYAQLGYPDDTVGYLNDQLWYGETDYLGELPTTEPAYDSQAMRDVLHAVETNGKHMMLIYGGWDPWLAGRLTYGDADDTQTFIKDQGNHDTKIADLEQLQRVQAFSMIKRWTGVEPVLSRLWRPTTAARERAQPHTPPLMAPARAARR